MPYSATKLAGINNAYLNNSLDCFNFKVSKGSLT